MATQEIGWYLIFGVCMFIAFYLAVSGYMNRERDLDGSGNMGGRRYAEELEFFETISPFVEAVKKPAGLMLSGMSTKDLKELEQKLTDAGLSTRLTMEDFIGMRIVGGLAGLMFGILMLLVGAPPMMAMACIFLFGMIGYVAPNSWLKNAATDRQAKIFRGLSDTLDVLAVTVNAGLELREALHRVVEIGSEPQLDKEIRRTLEEIDKGGKSLRQGFEDLRDRVSLPEMTAFCNVVLLAFQIGAAGMGEILMEQSTAIRRERVLRAERHANTMGSKILFPIAVFIFPAVIVTILGPMSLEAYMQFAHGG